MAGIRARVAAPVATTMASSVRCSRSISCSDSAMRCSRLVTPSRSAAADARLAGALMSLGGPRPRGLDALLPTLTCAVEDCPPRRKGEPDRGLSAVLVYTRTHRLGAPWPVCKSQGTWTRVDAESPWAVVRLRATLTTESRARSRSKHYSQQVATSADFPPSHAARGARGAEDGCDARGQAQSAPLTGRNAGKRTR